MEIIFCQTSKTFLGKKNKLKITLYCDITYARTHTHKSQKMKNTIKSGAVFSLWPSKITILLTEQERNKIQAVYSCCCVDSHENSEDKHAVEQLPRFNA